MSDVPAAEMTVEAMAAEEAVPLGEVSTEPTPVDPAVVAELNLRAQIAEAESEAKTYFVINELLSKGLVPGMYSNAIVDSLSYSFQKHTAAVARLTELKGKLPAPLPPAPELTPAEDAQLGAIAEAVGSDPTQAKN